MAKINFGGVRETVVTRKEFSLAKARQVLKKEVIAVIGYGVQGPAQALNMKDNGFNVIVGQAREFKRDWDRAVADGWVPGKTLFSIEEAAKRGTIIQMLVSDAAQRAIWPIIKANLKAGKALYFSHGFSITYKKKSGVVPPKNVDVIMVAPKGSGLNVRRNFLSGAGINSSYAVWQDATGNAEKRCLAIGIAIGSGYLFPTTFPHETNSDLVGERGVYSWAAWPVSWRRSTTNFVSMVTPPARPSMKPLKNSPRVSSDWWMKTAWIGCTPTARPPHSAGPWIGNRNLKRPLPRYSRYYTNALHRAKKPNGLLRAAVGRTIRRSWPKN